MKSKIKWQFAKIIFNFLLKFMGKATNHFDTEELVSRQVFNIIGDDAIKLFDPKALESLEAIREILNVPLICNN